MSVSTDPRQGAQGAPGAPGAKHLEKLPQIPHNRLVHLAQPAHYYRIGLENVKVDQVHVDMIYLNFLKNIMDREHAM